MIDLDGAIEMCLDHGYAQEDIIFDAIFLASEKSAEYENMEGASTV